MRLSNNATTKGWQQRLKMSRAALADRWFVALEKIHTASGSADADARFGMLVEILFVQLLESCWQRGDAEGVGDTLARLGYTHPETLMVTGEIWMEHLEQYADPTAWPSLLKRAFEVLNALAVGFCRRIQQTSTQTGLAISSGDVNDLIEQDSRLRAIFEGINLGIGLTDKYGRITLTNRALQKMFGYTDQELVGMSLTLLSHPDDLKITIDMFEALQEKDHQYYHVEKRYIHKNGHFFWARLTVSLINNAPGWEPFTVGILEDVTNRKQRELDLEELKQSLAKLRDVERLSLAQELHDGPVQHLLGISYQMEALTRRVAARQIASDDQVTLTPIHISELESLSSEVIESMKQLRGLISELRPAGLLELGLTAALEGFIARLENEQPLPLPDISLELDETGKDMPESVALCLFRVAQEAIRNAVRHANARVVNVSLYIRSPMVMLSVSDDGCGFDVPASINELTRTNHFGLAGIVERVNIANGQYRIISQVDKGTEILVWMDYTDDTTD